MKLDSALNEVQRHGVQKECFFSVDMKDAPHIFEILRNKLYRDKPSAVIRETIANAYDAHIIAGCPNRPFTIHAPTRLEPEFSVRDYGPGLSEDDVFDIYIKYGTSTKRSSNELIGQLGLGAKSPFAYTSVFTIISYYNGTKSVYTAFIDETNIGKMTKLSEQKTEEPNGVEVKVAVKREDIDSFCRIIFQCIRFYAVQPNLNLEPCPIKYVEFENDPYFSFIERPENSPERGIICVMGNIAYTVDKKMLNSSRESERVWEWIGQIYNAILVIKAQIGDVSVSASREDLEYTQKTISFINDRLVYIYQTIIKKCQEMLDSIKSEYELSCFFTDQTNIKQMPRIFRLYFSSMANIYSATITYKGKEIKTKVPEENCPHSRNNGMHHETWEQIGVRTRVYAKDGCSVITPRRIKYYSLYFSNTAIIINSKSLTLRRLYTLLDKNPDLRSCQYFLVITCESEKVIEEYIKTLPQGTPIYYLSQYEPAVITKTSSTLPKRDKRTKYNLLDLSKIIKHDARQPRIFIPVQKNKIQNGVYVSTKKGRTIVSFLNTDMNWTQFASAIESLKTIISIPEIYAISEGEKVFSNIPKIEDYIIPVIKSKYKIMDIQDSYFLEQVSSYQIDNVQGQFASLNDALLKSKFNIPPDIKEYIMRVHYLFKTGLIEFWSDAEVASCGLGGLEKMINPQPTDDLKKSMATIRKTYPFLPKIITPNFYTPNSYGKEVHKEEEILEYVAAIYKMRHEKGEIK